MITLSLSCAALVLLMSFSLYGMFRCFIIFLWDSCFWLSAVWLFYVTANVFSCISFLCVCICACLLCLDFCMFVLLYMSCLYRDCSLFHLCGLQGTILMMLMFVSHNLWSSSLLYLSLWCIFCRPSHCAYQYGDLWLAHVSRVHCLLFGWLL